MAIFARRCLDKMLNIVNDLEETLGPGTAELGMRFGLHSGPIIGGVLRGAKVRIIQHCLQLLLLRSCRTFPNFVFLTEKNM
jgi:class 3 adenylate cyclase